MPGDTPGFTTTYPAASGLVSNGYKQFVPVTLGNDGNVNVATALTQPVVGVAYNIPAAAGSETTVVQTGIARCVSAGTVSAGQFVGAAASGTVTAVASPASAYVVGIARSAAAAGEYVNVLLTGPGAIRGQ